MPDIEEMAEQITLAAELADEEVRERERPSRAWMKCFQEKLLRALEDYDER